MATVLGGWFLWSSGGGGGCVEEFGELSHHFYVFAATDAEVYVAVFGVVEDRRKVFLG